MTEIIYTPGVCNIGKEEIAKRKMVGYVGLAATIIVAAALVLLDVSKAWRLVIFLPAFVTASGFVQAYFHFCVAFGKAGVYNVGALGGTQTVTDTQAKMQDQKRTVRLYFYIALVAIVITAICFFLPR